MDGDNAQLTADIIQALHSRISNLELQTSPTYLGMKKYKSHRPYPPMIYPATATGKYRFFPPTPEGRLMFQKWFNSWWTATTKTEINFEITEENLPFVSVSEPSMMRNMFLKWLFIERPIVMEPFAGLGCDTITFLYNLAPRNIYCIENSAEMGGHPELGRTFRTLKKNIGNYMKAFPEVDPQTVELIPESVEVFMEKTKVPYVDLLYLDPPWILSGQKNECTPKELIEYLNEKIFNITGKWFTPKVICIKTRFEWAKFESALKEIASGQAKSAIGYDLNDYIRIPSDVEVQPFRRTYHFHTFLSKDVHDDVYWVKSKTWYDTYEGGKPREKWLPKAQNDKTNKLPRVQPVFEGRTDFFKGSPSDYANWVKEPSKA